jgi:hypothetical protein
VKIKRLGVIFSCALILSSCGASQSSGSSNLVCAFVEGYLDNKALALVFLAEGGSAAESIEGTIGVLSAEVTPESEARKVFDDFYSAMSGWAMFVDAAVALDDRNGITFAAGELEKKIDQIAPQCQELGWNFKKGWR